MTENGASVDVCVLRTAEVVHRVLSDRVVVRRIGDRSPDAAAELVGPAGVVWVACEQPISLDAIASDTGLTAESVAESSQLLLDAGWLTSTR